MSAKKSDLLNGVFHEIAYTFKKGGMQRLYYDGELASESSYNPEASFLTGFAVINYENKADTSKVDARFEIYGNALAEEEIRKSFSGKAR